MPQFAFADRGNSERDKKAFFDSRATPAAEKVLSARERDAAATQSPDVTALKLSLGREGIVDIDPLTNTARFVGKTDGFLTKPSNKAPADIALDFLRKNAKVFGIDKADVDGLTLTKDYVSIDGTHHLFFDQAAGGVPVFSNGIRANVTKNGELINFSGSRSPASAARSASRSSAQPTRSSPPRRTSRRRSHRRSQSRVPTRRQARRPLPAVTAPRSSTSRT